MDKQNQDDDVIIIEDNFLSRPFGQPPQFNDHYIQKSNYFGFISKFKSFIFGEQKLDKQDQELDELKKDVQVLKTNFNNFQNQRQQIQTLFQEMEELRHKQGYEYQVMCHQLNNLQQNIKHSNEKFQDDFENSIKIEQVAPQGNDKENDIKQLENKLLQVINEGSERLDQKFQQKIQLLNEQMLNTNAIVSNFTQDISRVDYELNKQIAELRSYYDGLQTQIQQLSTRNDIQKSLQRSIMSKQNSQNNVKQSLMKSTNSQMFQSCYQGKEKDQEQEKEKDEEQAFNYEFSSVPQQIVYVLFQPGHYNIPIIISESRNQVFQKVEDISKEWISKQLEPEFQDFIGQIMPISSNYQQEYLESPEQNENIIMQYQHVRGDGNCFYTTFMYQLLSQKMIDLDFLEQQLNELKYYIPDQLQYGQFNEKETHEVFNLLREKLAAVDVKELYKFINYQYYILLTIISRNFIYKLLKEDAESFEVFKLLVDDCDREILEWAKMCNSNEIIIKAISSTLNIQIEVITVNEGKNQYQIYQAEEIINNFGLLSVDKSKSLLNVQELTLQSPDKFNFRIIQSRKEYKKVKLIAIGLICLKSNIQHQFKQYNLNALSKLNYQQVDNFTQEDYKNIIEDVMKLLEILLQNQNLKSYNFTLESLANIIGKKLKIGIKIYSFDKKEIIQLNSNQQYLSGLIVKGHTIAIVE